MISWNWKFCLWISAFTVVLSLARIAVSIGRLIYCIHTGIAWEGSQDFPAWYTLILEDGFSYVGLIALVLAVVSAVKLRKKT